VDPIPTGKKSRGEKQQGYQHRDRTPICSHHTVYQNTCRQVPQKKQSGRPIVRTNSGVVCQTKQPAVTNTKRVLVRENPGENKTLRKKGFESKSGGVIKRLTPGWLEQTQGSRRKETYEGETKPGGSSKWAAGIS